MSSRPAVCRWMSARSCATSARSRILPPRLDGKKVTEKYVTVGGAVKNPVTLRVPVGISCRSFMDAAGGPTCDCKYIIGGPCMGRVVDTLDIPVTKTTGGLLAIPKDHPLLEREVSEAQSAAHHVGLLPVLHVHADARATRSA